MITFGPVPSRRLNTSLGVNIIVPPKQCSYSCIYCQVGKTYNKTIFRSGFYKPKDVLNKVKEHLKKLDISHKPDYLTLIANGEPTLEINIGEEINLLQDLGIPVAVITNSSLLDKEHTRADLKYADWVSVKVDSVNKKVWKKINAPHYCLNFEAILEGISVFSKEYNGILNTETMLVDGVNDSAEDLEQNATFISSLNPAKAYVSIPIRPPVDSGVKAAAESRIAEAWQIYNGHGIETETLTGFEGVDTGYTGDAKNDILNISSVHPIREDTMAELLQKDFAQAEVLDSLLNEGQVKRINYNGYYYYLRSYRE